NVISFIFVDFRALAAYYGAYFASTDLTGGLKCGITFSKARMISSSSCDVRHDGMDMMMLRSNRLSAAGHVPFPYRCADAAFSASRHGNPFPSTLRRSTRLVML